MKIVVLVKWVPDTFGERHLDPETGLVVREGAGSVGDEVAERALEVALRYAESTTGAEVVLMTMAPAGATPMLRNGLAMGAHSAVHIEEGALVGSDLQSTSEILAEALRQTGFDLVLCGNRSTDGEAGLLPAMLAERLELPAATHLAELEIDADGISGKRIEGDETLELRASLPALASVTESAADPRFPNLKGIMSAKRKPIEVRTAASLGVEPHRLDESRVILTSVAERPPREAGETVEFDATVPERVTEFLRKQGVL